MRTTLRRTLVGLAIVAAALGLVAWVGQTDPATNITATRATLNARGYTDDGPARWWWEYDTVRSELGTANDTEVCGKLPEPGRRCGPATGGSQSNPMPLGVTVPGLTPDTTYFFRSCGQDLNDANPSCASIRSFKTLPCPPPPPPLQYGDTIACSIGAAQEADEFRVTVAANTRVLLRMRSDSPVDPQVRLFDPNGNPLTACSNSATGPGIVEAQCTLTSSGPHTILASDFGGNETGGYVLHLQRLSNPAGATNCTAIGIGQTLSGTIGARAETDCFLFTGATNTGVLLRMSSAAGSQVDPQVRLYDPNGNALSLCSNSRSTPGTIQAQCTLNSSGPHTVLASDFGGDETGGYSVSVENP
jgi:hypothetical protein